MKENVIKEKIEEKKGHWLWDFQKHEIQDMAINKDFYIRCADFKESLSGFRLPSGQGGVLILWPVQWSRK